MSEKELKQIAEKITSELKPLFDSIMTMDRSSQSFKIFRESFAEYSKKLERVSKIFGFLTEDIEALRKGRFKTLNIIYSIFVYFGFLESYGNSLTDFIVMLLVANGRDFHIERLHRTPRIKHAVSIRDLEKERVSLTTKLNFMRDNGISELASIIDSKLRNDIAHMKFDVKEEMIYIRGKPADTMLGTGIRKFVKMMQTMRILAEQLVEDLEGELRKEGVIAEES